MTPKERVITTLQRREPDRVPTGENDVDYKLVERLLGRPTLYNARWDEVQALWHGRRAEIVADYQSAYVDLACTLNWDYVRVPTMPLDKEYHPPKMTGSYSWLDDDGYEMHYSPAVGNIATRVDTSHLTLDDLPDPDGPFTIDPSELEAIDHVVAELGQSHFIIGRSPIDGTFPFQQTVGLQEFLMRMITDPDYVHQAIELYVNRSIVYIEAMLQAGCDAVMTTDDYSGNHGPMMGPERFRKFIKPAIRRQVEAAHACGGYFIKHTDGNVWSILDDLIETGIDGWHGIQPNIGMDLRLLKERYGDRLCFFGGLNCETLIEGTPEQAQAEVRYAIEHAATGGGLVIATGNVVQPGARLENYLAANRAVKRYGRYPIRL